MNQIEEDMTTDAELAGEIKPEPERKKSELMRPEYSFKGTALFPYTPGLEIMFTQVRDREDRGLYTWLAFIFMLSKRNGESIKEHRDWMRPLAWKIDEFREAVEVWADEIGPFSDSDKMEAKRIYDEITRNAAESAVEPVPGRGSRGGQKKMRQKKNI